MKVINKIKSFIRKRGQFEFLSIPYMLMLIIFIVAPVFLIIFKSMTTSSGTITFDNYLRFVEDNFIVSLVRSLKYASISTVICLLLGYPLAYIISRAKPKNKAMIMLLITAPMWVNMLLKLNAWRTILSTTIWGEESAIILGIVYIYLPFMVIPIYTVLNKMDIKLIEASFDLGANRFQTFKRVILPLSIPAIISGIIMVFLPSATMYVIPETLGRKGFNTTIGVLIEQQFIKGGSQNYGSAISIIIAVTMMILLFISKKVDRYSEKE